MAGDTLFGTQTEAEWQQVRQTIKGWARQEVKAGREFTTGILLENVQQKLFPEDDTLPDDQKSVAFVADVKLIDAPGRPVVRDVLVANQAQQWIADAIGTPVMLKLDKTGQLQVIGRAGVDFDDKDDYVVKYVPIHDIDGNNLDFLFGLRYTAFSALSGTIQTQINAHRATLGLPLLYVPGTASYTGGIAEDTTYDFGNSVGGVDSLLVKIDGFNGSIDEVKALFTKVGSPTGTLTVRILNYDASAPQGVGDLFEEIGAYDVSTFPAGPFLNVISIASSDLSILNNYWLEIRSDLTPSATDYVSIHLDSTATPTTTTLVYDGNSYTQPSADLMFELGLVITGDAVYIDPVVHVLGDDYMPGYIATQDSVRGSTGGTFTCRQETTLVSWTDPRWVWGSTPIGWAAGTSSWGLMVTDTICTTTP